MPKPPMGRLSTSYERDALRALIDQFLDETTTYEDMFVSDLRDRVGDFRQAASDVLLKRP